MNYILVGTTIFGFIHLTIFLKTVTLIDLLFLVKKMRDIKNDLLNFIDGAELIIHNAPFDVGFLEHEYKKSKSKVEISSICKIFDTLVYARKLHPGQKNSLEKYSTCHLEL